MAIKFLDAIDLTGLELNNVRAQNNPGVPATALGEGQFLFDSTAKTLKYWNGTAWIELDGLGGVESVVTTDGSFINLTPNAAATGAVTVTADLSATGTPSGTTYLRGDNTWATITAGFAGFSIDGDNNSPQSISNGDTVLVLGGVGIGTVSSATDTITVNFDACSLGVFEDVVTDINSLVGCFGEDDTTGRVVIKTIPLSLFAAATSDIDMGGFQVSNINQTPVAASDAASKNYVDTTFAGSGALIFQGGYDATTAAPTGAAIKKGFTYAVTVAGTGSPAGFWNPTLEVGDLIIAEQDNPTSAANWTEINKNIDVATDIVQGIANFPTAGGLSVSAGAVSLASSGVTAGAKGSASKSATVTVDAKGIVTALSDQDISISASQITSFCTEVESCVAAREYTEIIGGAASIDVTHNLGTLNVMVQVYENSGSYQNVEVSIGRKNTNTVNIVTAVASGENSLVCLISKIGA